MAHGQGPQGLADQRDSLIGPLLKRTGAGRLDVGPQPGVPLRLRMGHEIRAPVGILHPQDIRASSEENPLGVVQLGPVHRVAVPRKENPQMSCLRRLSDEGGGNG